jgi:aspartyl protease family protein
MNTSQNCRPAVARGRVLRRGVPSPAPVASPCVQVCFVDPASGLCLGRLRPAASVPKAADGHFWAEAEVDGRALRLLVDTGASAVALTPADARRLGLDPARLDYSRRITTAAGSVRAAPVVLDHVTVAGARVERVSALVVSEGLSASLLGMSYLGRLSGFSADRAALVLRS